MVYLRGIESADVERIMKWHNCKELYDNLVGVFRYVNRQNEEEWIINVSKASNNYINLAICIIGTNEHIGNIYLRNIDWISRNAEMHIFIGDMMYRSKGYGFHAWCLLMDYAFKTLGLNRLYCHVLSSNEKAIKLYEKCNFTVEGLLKKHVFKNGVFCDVVIMGICIDEYNG